MDSKLFLLTGGLIIIMLIQSVYNLAAEIISKLKSDT